MRIRILMDNNAPSGLACEWGFSALFETDGPTPFCLLLDFGETSSFADNARALGVDLSAVDACVLSHAHSDHSGGIPAFLELNGHAPIFVSHSVAENCWWKDPHSRDAVPEYIGIQRGTLDEAESRIVRIRAATPIAPGICILPHAASGLEAVGAAQGMLVEDGTHGESTLRCDDFAHEISVVFELADGIIVASGCSHAGAAVTVREAQAAFPGRKIKAVVGGLHLYETPADEVERFARELLAAGVERVITGHCTGEAVGILRTAMGPDRISTFQSGAVFDI